MTHPPSWLVAFPDAEPTTTCVAQCLRGFLLVPGSVDLAQHALLDIAAHAKDGFVLDSIVKGKPDLVATLWFARAAYQYRKSTAAPAAWNDKLLPLLKKTVQSVVGGAASGLRMDDGGLLAPAAGGICPIGINALWYFMLSMLAEELHAVKDHAGDHFERLAGRFRRSFSKAFWCSAHGFLCDPELQKNTDHATADVMADPTQLLIATMAFSPIPRTKQRQIVLAIREKNLAPRGVLMPKTSAEGGLKGGNAAPQTASALHLAWLIEALIATSDTPEKSAAEAQSLLPPAGPQARFYVGDKAAGIEENKMPHAPSTAEMDAVRKMCGA
jgi:hypothetical protein